MMIRTRIAFASLLLVAGFAQATPATYKLDPNHTMVVASWSHFGFSHPVANFANVDGTLVYDADKVGTSSVTVTLPVSALQTNVPKLNEHLQSKDFFDMAQYPNATFKSTKVEAAGKGKLKVTGDLTIRDKTHPVVLDVTINKSGEFFGAPRIGFDATTTIKRSDFGMAMGVPNVSDEVQLRITAEGAMPKPEGAEAK